MFWVSSKNRLPLTIALLVGMVVVVTIFRVSHAVGAAKGRTYSGTVIVPGTNGQPTRDLSISFGVSRSGKRVDDFRFSGGLPKRCAVTSVGDLSAASAPIVKPSAFLARIPIQRNGTRVGTVLVSGSFTSLDREAGVLETKFTAVNLRNCDATGDYSASVPGSL